MTRHLIEQIKEIEAEADRILAEAEQNAKALEASVQSATAVLRQAQEAAFARQMDDFRAKLERETSAELEKLDGQARQLAGRLESLDAGAVRGAVELVLRHLREG